MIGWSLVRSARAGLLILLGFAACGLQAAQKVRVASMNFNESYLLAEMVVQVLEQAGFEVERRFGLGGTLICYEALVNDEIDVYVEYTGTLGQAILNRSDLASIRALNEHIADRGIELLEPFGFDNTYAMAMPRDRAEAAGLRRIGDLAGHPELKIVVSHEFLEREDGWRGLARAYGLPVRAGGIEHGLAYQAIADGAIDVTDAYSTDGELERYDLLVLEDDLSYFPEYLAAPLARSDLPASVRTEIGRLANLIDDQQMQRLNAEVVFGGRTFSDVANGFLVGAGLVEMRSQEVGAQEFRVWADLLRNTARHLQLTLSALLAAVIAGVGLSVLVFRMPVLARSVTYLCGLLQTVPSIALLALMIPVFGIGALPAIVALFLYSLLPILRNTLTALTTVDPVLIRVAVAMGLSPRQQLRHVFIPLSLPSMLAGIRTAAVISIGTATLAAFIGAGGLGDPIVTGLALNDAGLILQGAVPAALLAVATELVFEGVERLVLPGHLSRGVQSVRQ